MELTEAILSGKQTIWTILITYSMVQGILLALYAAVKYRQFYLSGLLLATSILLLGHLYQHFAWYLTAPHWMWVQVPAYFLIGPFFLLYTKSQYGHLPWNWRDLIHFIPAVLALLWFSEFYFTLNGEEKTLLFVEQFGNEFRVDYVKIVYVSHFVYYAFQGLRLARENRNKIHENESDSTIVHYGWIQISYLSFMVYGVITLLTLLAFLVSMTMGTGQSFQPFNSSYAFSYLALAVIIHGTVFYHFFHFKPNEAPLSQKKAVDREVGKYASSSLNNQQLKDLLGRLQKYIIEFEAYRNPNLRISDIAEELDIPSHHISQCLNQELRKNFFDFINEYRVEAVKENLSNPKYKNYTLFAIASEFGFNSNSSFYRIFKKSTGLTPKAYMEMELKKD